MQLYISISLLCIGGLLLLLAAHPFVTFPLSLVLLAKARPQALAASTEVASGGVAICVCAYNEEAVIGSRIDNMLALRASLPNLQIFVYVDASDDATTDIVQSYGNSIRSFVSLERHGKTYGMNKLVSMANVEFIIFSDANVLFADDAITHLLEPFADPFVGCVCGRLIYTLPGNASATAEIGSFYWRLEERIRELESRTGSVMGADGSIFAIRKCLHEPPPVDLIDDMHVSLSILCNGYRIVRAGRALAYESIVSTPAEEFRRKIRIACQAFNVHRALWPKLRKMSALNKYKYVSHKLIRWLTIYLLFGAWASFTFAIMAASGVLLACGFAAATAVVTVLIFVVPLRLPSRLADIISAFAAAGIGIKQSLAGDRFQTWTPPTSARSTVVGQSFQHDSATNTPPQAVP